MLIAFCLFSILLRWPSFFASVIDHDESTYLIVADQLLRGYIPYVDNIDVKPPMIYLLFAGILSLCHHVIAVRFFAAIVIGVTGFLLYRSHLILFTYRKISILTGALYILCASAHKWSWSANTEVFFICCTVACLYLILIGRKYWHFLLFGFITSIGFLLKLHIVFDILGLSIFYFFWGGKHFVPWAKRMLVSLLAFSVPIVFLFLLYRYLGHVEQLLFALYNVPLNYASDFDMMQMLNYVAEFYLSFLPFSILMAYGVYHVYRNRLLLQPQWILFLAGTVCSWLAILITGKMFFHYYFQALVPFCLFTFILFIDNKHGAYFDRKFTKKWLWIIGIFLVLCVWTNQYRQVWLRADVPRMVLREILPDWGDSKRLYTNDKNILYFLLNTDPPTRFTHTTILYKADLIQAYQVDVVEEFRNIVDQRMDYYVVRDVTVPLLENDIHENFELQKVFPDGIKLYRRLGGD